MKEIRKIIALIGVFLMCLSLGACNKKETDIQELITDEVVETKEVITEVLEPEPVAYTYDLEYADWVEEGITISYPVVVSSNVKGMVEGVNDIIRTDLRKFIAKIKTNADKVDGLTIDASCDYDKSFEPILSISYLGTYFIDDAAYPVNFYHTITIYLPDLKVVPLSELFNINEAFVETFKWGIYAPLRDDLDLEASEVNVQDLISQQYSDEELINLFSQPDANYFLADQGVILSIEVPHAVGDHLEMANTYENIEGNFKVDHPLWRDYNYIIYDEVVDTSEATDTERTFETVSEPFPTEDQKMIAQVLRFEGDVYDFIRLTSGEEVLVDLPLEGVYAPQILEVEWLNSNQYFAITSHINPSMNQYLLVDLSKGYEVTTYLGFEFIWNADWSNMYYIQAAPHFSEDTIDSLVDKNGNIFYQTESGNRLAGTLAITPDEKYFVCEIYTPEEATELLLLEMKDKKTMAVIGKMTDYKGVPAFADNETLTLTEDGIIEEIKISELIQ